MRANAEIGYHIAAKLPNIPYKNTYMVNSKTLAHRLK